jgi:hypothetical protein
VSPSGHDHADLAVNLEAFQVTVPGGGVAVDGELHARLVGDGLVSLGPDGPRLADADQQQAADQQCHCIGIAFH